MIGVGSSPRGRGTPKLPLEAPGHPRFIPARAGNTRRHGGRPRRWTVHPRAGGEHSYRLRANCRPVGSSPRGRGTPPGRRRARCRCRFIPARAGNTRLRAPPCSRLSVHPRAGGEHRGWRPGVRHDRGSSPRGRGTPCTPIPPRPRPRFIPARAGNTSTPATLRTKPAVHPRAGGEHSPSRSCSARQRGSSPRGRGTRRGRWRRPTPRRFIPARAGNTLRYIFWRIELTVHPRAGGEHMPSPAVLPPESGSSPRGRGTRRCPEAANLSGRFIPARAGNTLLATD